MSSLFPAKTAWLVAMLACGASTAACAQGSEAAPASAPQGLQRVEVSSGQPVRLRHDVQVACPGMALALDDSLAYAVRMLGQEGTVRVEFKLDHNRVASVTPSGGPRQYASQIRRAVRALHCSNGGREERFAFAIRFELPTDQAAPQRLAVLALP